MAKTITEIFDDKVSLIYEYNKKSPLFLRMANTEIENNNIDKAIEILNEGIKIYPNYAAAFLLLGKANILIGNYSAALKFIRKGSDFIHSKKTYDYYLKELENMKRQRSLFKKNSRTSFLPQTELPESENELELFEDEKGTNEIRETINSAGDHLDQIDKEITNGKIPDDYENDILSSSLLENFPDNNMIVTETLAKIYASQGEFKDAIEVYKKLIIRNPQKSEYYNQKINQLKSELEL